MDVVELIKLASQLLYPAGLILLCALGFTLCSLLRWRRAARVLLSMGILIFFVFSSPRIASELASGLERQYPQVALTDLAQHDAIIVLGGGLRIPLPPAKTVQLGRASDRYWYAAQLVKANKAKLVVISGGNVFAQPGYQGEAFYAAQLLQSWGVPAEQIVVESSSRTTGQNFQQTDSLIRQYNIQSAILVTSALHMPRAFALFQNLPIPITPASTDVLVRQANAPAWQSWLPSAAALQLSTRALHEIYGHWFDQLKSWWNRRV